MGITTAIATGALPLFIAATIAAGAGQGIAISAVTGGLLQGSTVVDRAPIFAVINLLCYGGATIPSLVSGRLSNTVALPQIVLGYGAFAFIGTLFTVIAARNPQTDATSRPDEQSRQRQVGVPPQEQRASYSEIDRMSRWMGTPCEWASDSGCPGCECRSPHARVTDMPISCSSRDVSCAVRGAIADRRGG